MRNIILGFAMLMAGGAAEAKRGVVVLVPPPHPAPVVVVDPHPAPVVVVEGRYKKGKWKHHEHRGRW